MITSYFVTLALAATPLKVRVEGEGYLRFALDGRVVYAKQATLIVSEGHLRFGSADVLPAISVPSCEGVNVDLEGHVVATISGSQVQVGQLVLATFPTGTTLLPTGDYLTASNRPTLGSPGEGLNGVIRIASAQVDAASNKSNKSYPTYTSAKPNTQHRTPNSNAQRPKPNASARTEIILNLDSTVSGESFSLGEIAEIDGDETAKAQLAKVDLGRAPAIGVTRGIDRIFVEAKLRTAGFLSDKYTITVPQGAHLERASQTITGAQMLETAKEAVKAQLGLDMPLHLTSNVADVVAPVGELVIDPKTVMKSGNSISLMIDIRVDDKHVTTRNLTLAPNQGTGEGIKPGQMVKLIVRMNGASVEIGGRARTGGWVGETVTVVTDTGAVKSGVVTSATTVEVKL